MTIKTPAFNYHPRRLINPRTRNSYIIGYSCFHVFINVQFRLIFLKLCFGSHDFSVFAHFDVLSRCYFYNDIIMMQREIRKESFDVLTRLKLHLRRQDTDAFIWFTQTRSEEGTVDRP